MRQESFYRYSVRNIILLIVIALLFGLYHRAPGAQPGARSFYLDPAGADSSSGTSPSTPWRTVARVNATALDPGDTFYFKRGGIWREMIDPIRGGAAGSPVTFTAYGSGPPPIISGSDVVTGWAAAGGGVYRAHSLKPNNVYLDGGPGWGLTHACCPAGSSCQQRGPCAIGPMAAGSWYWDQATSALYVWLADGSDPSSHKVEAAVRLYGVRVIADAGEKSNLVMDGLRFERTGAGGVYFYTNAERGVGLTGIVVRNCTVTQTGTGQVDDGSYYNGIHYDEAIELPTAPVFENNTISYTGNHGNAINSQNADNARILYNNATHFNHHGFDMKHSKSDLVLGNVAHDSIETNGIYQEYCADTLIEQNIVYNIAGTMLGHASGIQIDLSSTGAHIINNSIFNVLSGIYLNQPALVEYNAVAYARSAVLEANRGGVFSHNVWGSSPVLLLNGKSYDFEAWKAAGHLDDVAADPMWTDAEHGDFRLLPSSPCSTIKAGATFRRLSP
jgi:parallel beta helix pectate lyase-like protein